MRDHAGVTTSDVDRSDPACRAWVDRAVADGRGRRPPQRRHPPAGLPAAARVGRPALPQGRVDPPDRQPEAPAGPVAVPLRPVLRADHRGQHGGGGLQRVDGGQRGLLRPHARTAVRGGHAGGHQPREDRADRVPRRPLPLRRPGAGHLRGGAAARGRVRRALPRPVHLRRAGHRLARQQQHRRVDLRAARPRVAPGARVGRRRRGHRRHERHDRPLPAVPAAAHPAGRRRPGGVVVLPRLAGRRPGDGDRPVLPHRGHRPARGSSPRSCRRSSTG